jgi:hypothetical protein
VNRWIVIAVALVIGFFMLSYDQRTDDAGVEAVLLLAASLTLTIAAPRAALAIALAIGLPIVAYDMWHGNGPAIIALVFAFVGAGLGYLMRRTTLTPSA